MSTTIQKCVIVKKLKLGRTNGGIFLAKKYKASVKVRVVGCSHSDTSVTRFRVKQFIQFKKWEKYTAYLEDQQKSPPTHSLIGSKALFVDVTKAACLPPILLCSLKFE